MFNLLISHKVYLCMERAERNKRVSDLRFAAALRYRIISVLIVPQSRLLQEVYSSPSLPHQQRARWMIRPKPCPNNASITRDSSLGNGWGLHLLNTSNLGLANCLDIVFPRCLSECLDEAVNVINRL